MNTYFYKLYLGPGIESTGLIKTQLPPEEIDQWLREECIQFACSYGYDQDEDYFGGSLDQVGRDWDEDEECYEDERELEYWYEPYDPEEHDYQVLTIEFEEI